MNLTEAFVLAFRGQLRVIVFGFIAAVIYTTIVTSPQVLAGPVIITRPVLHMLEAPSQLPCSQPRW